MDLRRYDLTPRQIERAVKVLDYQPFIISDDIQTGVAWSWLHAADPRQYPKLIFRRGEPEWEDAARANESLRRLYDGFLDEIANRFPGGSLLDVGCNNGYFPVGAELRGMRGCGGVERNFRERRALRFLNEAVGTRASFYPVPFLPRQRAMPMWRKFDVVSTSALMCHLPNPLDFLVSLARVTREAFFFWGQVVEVPEMAIFYQPPHAAIRGTRRNFPYNFNDNTRLSRPLFEHALHELGFTQVVEIEPTGEALNLPNHVGLLAIR